MTLHLRTLSAILLATICFGAPRDANSQDITPVPFERPNVLAFHLTSDYVDPVMLVEVALPVFYSPEKSYPVMYFTDGLTHFPLLASNNFLLSSGDESFSPGWIPEVITVGIDFVIPLEEIDRTRLVYLTPTEAVDEDYGLIGGRADDLLDFIRHELKPFIDATFQTDAEQELFAGHSLGGLFSLYALFTQPDLFEKFIAASPSNYWDDEVIFNFEEAYRSSDPVDDEHLYMSVGSREDPWGVAVDYVSRLGRQIEEHNYENLTFERAIFPGHTHNSVVVDAYAAGARFGFLGTESQRNGG